MDLKLKRQEVGIYNVILKQYMKYSLAMSGPKHNKTVANLQRNDMLPMLLKQTQLHTGPTVKILPVTLVIEYRVIASFPDDEDI